METTLLGEIVSLIVNGGGAALVAAAALIYGYYERKDRRLQKSEHDNAVAKWWTDYKALQQDYLKSLEREKQTHIDARKTTHIEYTEEIKDLKERIARLVTAYEGKDTRPGERGDPRV